MAYSNGEIVGEARVVHESDEADAANVLYLSIAGDGRQSIWFTIERDGEIQPFLDNVYRLADFHVARYMERGFTNLMFSFGCTGGQHRSVYGKWYSISGMLLQKKPTQRGIYIFNGKKVMMK